MNKQAPNREVRTGDTTGAQVVKGIEAKTTIKHAQNLLSPLFEFPVP